MKSEKEILEQIEAVKIADEPCNSECPADEGCIYCSYLQALNWVLGKQKELIE